MKATLGAALWVCAAELWETDRLMTSKPAMTVSGRVRLSAGSSSPVSVSMAVMWVTAVCDALRFPLAGASAISRHLSPRRRAVEPSPGRKPGSAGTRKVSQCRPAGADRQSLAAMSANFVDKANEKRTLVGDLSLVIGNTVSVLGQISVRRVAE